MIFVEGKSAYEYVGAKVPLAEFRNSVLVYENEGQRTFPQLNTSGAIASQKCCAIQTPVGLATFAIERDVSNGDVILGELLGIDSQGRR